MDQRDDTPAPPFSTLISTSTATEANTESVPSQGRILSLIAVTLLGSCILNIINLRAGALVPVPAFGSTAGHVASVIYLTVLLTCLLSLAQAATRLRVSAPFLICTGVAFAIPVFVSILSGLGAAAISHPFGALAGTLDALPFAVRFATANVLGPLGMILAGVGFGRLFRHPNTLLAGAGFAIFFDLVVVTMGTVAQLMKGNSNVISMVSVGAGATGMTSPGMPHHTIVPISTVTIGPADVLFVAVFLSAVRALKLDPKSTFWWMFGLLLTALTLVETTALPVPALVPMGLAVLIANGRFAAFTRTEKRDLAIGTVFAFLCAALMILGARRLLPAASPTPPRYGFRVASSRYGPGLVVTEVVIGAPAQVCGLKPGDLIIAAGGMPITAGSMDAFDHARAAPGGMALTVRRAGSKRPIDLLLKAAGR